VLLTFGDLVVPGSQVRGGVDEVDVVVRVVVLLKLSSVQSLSVDSDIFNLELSEKLSNNLLVFW
jgi:hypothetical protein